jgi:hypothetical protein
MREDFTDIHEMITMTKIAAGRGLTLEDRGCSEFISEGTSADTEFLESLREKGGNNPLVYGSKTNNSITSESGLEFHTQSNRGVPHPDINASQVGTHQEPQVTHSQTQGADPITVREDHGTTMHSKHPPEGAPVGSKFLETYTLACNSRTINFITPEPCLVSLTQSIRGESHHDNNANQASIQQEPLFTQSQSQGVDSTTGMKYHGTQISPTAMDQETK